MPATILNLHQTAIDAAVEVLDTMFFELPIGLPGPGAPPQQDSLCALARFTGTADGELAVSIPQPSLHSLAASFLGADASEITTVQAAAVLSELANMLCGSTLSRIDPNGRIAIAPPKVIPVAEVSSSRWIRFPLECGTVAIALTYRGQ